ncbi:heme peroxidase [Blyttiomyces helicus]|uniref:Heme peroxidase n=1 Tax=Blyttiomyces helicus TaxID=388810 RepID=A0A4P9WFT2_9FUNG|nr:heme peroxidase [Blyttiomyces helicus]|eukprot:RKO91514.1 heme peroxidase [Blyttiomyces helicus]
MLVGELPPAYAGYDPNVDPSIDLFWTNIVLLRYEEDGQPSSAGHVFSTEQPFLRGFAMQPENKMDIRYVEEVRDTFGCGTSLATFHVRFDLAAVDIQRCRKVGLPDYNTARRHFIMSEISTWSDFTPDTQNQGILASLYPNISRLDAYIGTMSEPHEGDPIVGPLIAASIKNQLLRIRSGDRFWWENPAELTQGELAVMNNHSGMGQAFTPVPSSWAGSRMVAGAEGG